MVHVAMGEDKVLDPGGVSHSLDVPDHLGHGLARARVDQR